MCCEVEMNVGDLVRRTLHEGQEGEIGIILFTYSTNPTASFVKVITTTGVKDWSRDACEVIDE